MQRVKSIWKSIPDKPRRIATFVIGVLLIIISGLIGWIPGPGGMVPFLLGIALLATEFTWAERVRDYILNTLKKSADYISNRPRLRTLLVVITVVTVVIFAYALSIYIL